MILFASFFFLAQAKLSLSLLCTVKIPVAKAALLLLLPPKKFLPAFLSSPRSLHSAALASRSNSNTLTRSITSPLTYIHTLTHTQHSAFGQLFSPSLESSHLSLLRERRRRLWLPAAVLSFHAAVLLLLQRLLARRLLNSQVFSSLSLSFQSCLLSPYTNLMLRIE